MNWKGSSQLFSHINRFSCDASILWLVSDWCACRRDIPERVVLARTTLPTVQYPLQAITGAVTEQLHATMYSQPAVVVASLAAVERLYAVDSAAVEDCVAAAGFSVGEITALIFSGALTFDDGM